MSSLDGYKTYILAACAALYGIFGFLSGNLDANTALQVVWAAAAAAGIRHGIAKS